MASCSIDIIEKYTNSLECRFSAAQRLRSSQGEFRVDLEKFGIVEILLILVNWSAGGLISAECQFFCPVAFFVAITSAYIVVCPHFCHFEPPILGLFLDKPPPLP